MPSFRVLPHGPYSLVPAVLTTMAWLASLFQDGCDYSRLTGPIVGAIALNPDAPWLEVGFAAYREPIQDLQSNEWHVVYSGTCLVYPASVVTVDGWWKSGKACAFLALVLGGSGTFFLWFSTCCVFSKATWRWAGYQVLLASLFQAFSFVWFKTALCHIESDGSQCELFWGSKADAVATSFWAMASLTIFLRYPKPKDLSNSEDGLLVANSDGAIGTDGRRSSRWPVVMNPNETGGGGDDDDAVSLSSLSQDVGDAHRRPAARRRNRGSGGGDDNHDEREALSDADEAEKDDIDDEEATYQMESGEDSRQGGRGSTNNHMTDAHLV